MPLFFDVLSPYCVFDHLGEAVGSELKRTGTSEVLSNNPETVSLSSTELAAHPKLVLSAGTQSFLYVNSEKINLFLKKQFSANHHFQLLRCELH